MLTKITQDYGTVWYAEALLRVFSIYCC